MSTNALRGAEQNSNKKRRRGGRGGSNTREQEYREHLQRMREEITRRNELALHEQRGYGPMMFEEPGNDDISRHREMDYSVDYLPEQIPFGDNPVPGSKPNRDTYPQDRYERIEAWPHRDGQQDSGFFREGSYDKPGSSRDVQREIQITDRAFSDAPLRNEPRPYTDLQQDQVPFREFTREQQGAFRDSPREIQNASKGVSDERGDILLKKLATVRDELHADHRSFNGDPPEQHRPSADAAAEMFLEFSTKLTNLKGEMLGLFSQLNTKILKLQEAESERLILEKERVQLNRDILETQKQRLAVEVMRLQMNLDSSGQLTGGIQELKQTLAQFQKSGGGPIPIPSSWNGQIQVPQIRNNEAGDAAIPARSSDMPEFMRDNNPATGGNWQRQNEKDITGWRTASGLTQRY